MGQAWRSSTPLIASVNDNGIWDYSFSDCPAGSSLLRTIIYVYAYGVDIVPTAFNSTDNAWPNPVAFTLSEVNSEVNPSFPSVDPWGITGSGHELAGGILEMRASNGVKVTAITGSTSLNIGGGQDYDLTIEGTQFEAITGYIHVDSQAQRLFTRGDASFVFQAKAGPLASFISSTDYIVVARIMHLIRTP